MKPSRLSWMESWRSDRGRRWDDVKFYENSFVRPDGTLVEGVVDIELIDYSKADMLLIDVPTNGLNDAGEVQALVPGGEIYLNASHGGEPVELAAPWSWRCPRTTQEGPTPAWRSLRWRARWTVRTRSRSERSGSRTSAMGRWRSRHWPRPRRDGGRRW